MTTRRERSRRSRRFLPVGYSWIWASVSKTVIALTAVDYLMHDAFEVAKALVIAPLRVAEDTWSREADKWDHLKTLRISKILGSAAERRKGLTADADIYVINRENVKWLVEECQEKKHWPFDMIIIDELSSFKSNKSQRFKYLRKVIPLTDRVVGLTGTPSPNGLMDLWAQIYLLDRGERLGKTLTAYRDRYFVPGKRNGYTVFTWDLKQGAAESIQAKVSDICISMSASDYLQLPERIDNEIRVKLSPAEMKTYRQMERDQLIELDGADVVALNAAAVAGKLLQMANGSVYDDVRNVIRIHEKKLDALEELIDVTDDNILVFYNFRHDLDALRDRFDKLSPRELKTEADIREWNDGKIKVLLAHPASVGYGLNIQDGGHTIIWYGLTWSLELYQQANARLYRQGQIKNVIVHHLIAEGTIDEQVMRVLTKKQAGQEALLEALKERLEEYE